MKLMKHGITCGMAWSFLLLPPLSGTAGPLTTRQQTVMPLNLPTNTPQIGPSNIPLYAVYGYSSWSWAPGEDQGRKFDLMPAGYAGATNAARLLSFFSMSDVHITDKESPAQIPYYGWAAPFNAGPLYASSYEPNFLATTHVLDAAVKTINSLHRQTPFNFGICLGDVANNNQYNELRWFIDVMDGQYITPSSGDHLGATNIGYQMPYQAAGLDRSIPWYQVVGNHDQFWQGAAYPSEKIRNALVGSNVLNMGTSTLATNATELTGLYVGVVDGTTPYGDVVKGGPTNWFSSPPTVAADLNRRALTTDFSSTTNFMSEFFKTATLPVGHGFHQSNIDSNSACYTFEPVTNLPIKVIVLDDLAKTNIPNAGAAYCAKGSMDATRYAWLTNELQMGQDADQLMILACHVPINPQAGLFTTNSSPQFNAPPLSAQTDAQLIATLHQYPNLILLMAGHRHMNIVTPQPSPDPAHPEFGFWEVETPSLRDFSQQFRTWEILRNSDNTISILTTDVNPVVESNTPAGDARGYAIGVLRILGFLEMTNTTSHAYNAELVKPLTSVMQAKIARLGGPLGHLVSMDRAGTGTVMNFMGTLQSADAITGPWTNVTGTTNQQYAAPAANGAKFYRAAE